MMAANASSTLFLLLPLLPFFFVALTSASNITQVLSGFPEFSAFNNLLIQTKLVDQINKQGTVTVLAVAASGLGATKGLSPDDLKRVLSVHVILDYYDADKIKNITQDSTTLPTLYKPSVTAHHKQGFVNMSKIHHWIKFGSAVPGASQDSELIDVVVNKSSTLSVLHVSSIIVPPGIGKVSPPTTTSPPPAHSPSPKAQSTPPTKSPPPAKAAVAVTPAKAPAPATHSLPPIKSSATANRIAPVPAPSTKSNANAPALAPPAKAAVAVTPSKAPAPATHSLPPTKSSATANRIAPVPAPSTKSNANAPALAPPAKAAVAVTPAKAPAPATHSLPPTKSSATAKRIAPVPAPSTKSNANAPAPAAHVHSPAHAPSGYDDEDMSPAGTPQADSPNPNPRKPIHPKLIHPTRS